MIDIASQPAALSAQLREQIQRAGRITFCDWMRTALYDPAHGYYRAVGREIWGREGDYRTSPERSDLFAATFARHFASLYRQLDSPALFTIVEVGGGAGYFAAGVLQTLQNYFPEVFQVTRYVFDELSETAQAAARVRLNSFSSTVEFARSEGIEIDAGIVFSNELLDAFPVHRVKLVDGSLCEYYVTLDGESDFKWSLGPPSTPLLADYLKRYEVSLREDQSAEINLEIDAWLAIVSAKLKRGYVVTVDYGAEAEELYSADEHPNGTLRSFHQHGFVEDLLSAPGEHDLTSSVNWTAVKAAGASVGLKTLECVRQDKFLLEAGLLEQLELQSKQASEAEKARLTTAAREMVLPNGMAASFQVLVEEKV